jgi:hypothetical protein
MNSRPIANFATISENGSSGDQSSFGGTIGGQGHLMGIGAFMTREPKRQEPDIPPQKPDIQPEPGPEEIPQDKDFPEKESPPEQL